VLAGASSAALADDQQQQQQQKQQQPTDVGRVSTGAGANEQTVVKPSPETSRAAAIEEKKQAPNIVDVQPLSEIVKLPDINTAEALQRIPGISLETDSGEGRFVHIRGLDADLNGTTYGGVRLPASNASSPSGGGRAVAFDTFPTGIVGGIEVTKTLRPDMDAEGLGGTINLVPRSGAEHGGAPFLDANLGGGYEPLRTTPVYHGEFSAGRSFDGGDGIGGLFAGKDAFSAVASVVYHEDWRGIDDVEAGYDDAQSSGVPDRVLSSVDLRWYEYHRRRYGAAFNFDAKATEATSLYLRVLYSGYLEHADKHILTLGGLANNDGCTPLPTCIQDPNNSNGFISDPTGAPGTGTLTQKTTDSLERIQNLLGVIGGSSVFPGFKVDYHASWAQGTDSNSSDSFGSSWRDSKVSIAYDSTTDSRYPTFTILNGVNLADPANYKLRSIGFGPSSTSDSETAAQVDVTVPIGSGDHLGEWKGGLSLRQRHKISNSTSLSFDPTLLTALPNLANYTSGPPQIFYNGHYNIGPAISFSQIRALVAANPQAVSLSDPAGDIAGSTIDDENVYAAYLQYEQRFGPAGVLLGVRVEHTDARYSGFVFNGDNDDALPADLFLTTTTNAYTNVFPTVQGRYDFLPDLVGRLTYSTGIARPGFQQITPGVNYSPSTTSSPTSPINIGNPNLKPTTGQSFDATLEWYPGDGEIASVGLFYKLFDNYILMQEQSVADYVPPGTGLDLGQQYLASWLNGPAHADGVEGQWEQKLLFLPGPLAGLGYELNFTLVDSSAQIHPGIKGLLPSTSRVTWNAALFYERGPIEVRVASDYVGQNLFAFGSAEGNSLDVYSRARLTLDLGASYAIANGVKIYFDAKNLLNTPLAFIEGPDRTRYIQREFYDATYLLGVRMKF
jgi:TonB-dependent receptor